MSSFSIQVEGLIRLNLGNPGEFIMLQLAQHKKTYFCHTSSKTRHGYTIPTLMSQGIATRPSACLLLRQQTDDQTLKML